MKRTPIVASRTGKRLFLTPITVLIFAGLCFSQKVTLGPKVGPPTTQVLVSGTGFSPNAAIDIYFDTTDEALAIANGDGVFSKIPIQVPSSALPGNHWVSAVQRSTGTGAQAAFLVQTNWAEFGFTPKNKRVNPYENVLSPTTVGQIDLQWSYATGSTGFGVISSPAVANGVVYVGSVDDNVYALNATTGAKLWSYTSAGPVQSSPAVANGVVYVGSNDYNVYALNATTGALLWSYTTGNVVTTSPAVANGVVYVGSGDNNLYALNARTGALMWKYATGAGSSPAVANGVVYVGSAQVYALNATTGALLWSYTTGNNFVVTSSPAVANGVVYVGSVDNALYALNALNARTGALIWSYATGNVIYSSPAVANNWVYVGSADHNVYGLYVESGVPYLQWKFLTGDGVSSSPTVANGVVYVGSADHNLYALSANGGADLWSYPTGGVIISSPAVANGVVYVGSEDDNVYAFDLQGGTEIQKASQPPDLRTLRANLNLKVAKPVAAHLRRGYDD